MFRLFDSAWRKWRRLLTDSYRPWYQNGLPEDLQFTEFAGEYFREGMLRAANLSVSLRMPFFIFQMIGLDYAKRATRTMWPRELVMMEDVSVAYDAVYRRACEGRIVPAFHRERFVELLMRYFEYLGEYPDREAIVRQLDAYILDEQKLAREP